MSATAGDTVYELMPAATGSSSPLKDSTDSRESSPSPGATEEVVSMARLCDSIAECAALLLIHDYNELYEELSCLVGKRIDFDGIISGGKTTMGERIEKYLRDSVGIDTEFQPEKISPMLGYFYNEMERVRKGLKKKNEASFPFQLQMLMSRIESYKRACDHRHRTWIGDRGPSGDAVFASIQHADGHINKEEFAGYLKTLLQVKYAPDYLVFLDVSAGEAERRKNERARKEEDKIPRAYFHRLRLGYWYLLLALASKTLYRILLIRNNVVHEPLYILRRIARSPPPKRVRKIFSRAPHIVQNETRIFADPAYLSQCEKELDDAFEMIHAHYDKYEAAAQEIHQRKKNL